MWFPKINSLSSYDISSWKASTLQVLSISALQMVEDRDIN